MSLTVHSDLTHSPRYWVTFDNRAVFDSDDGATALQYAIDNSGNNIMRLDGTIEVTSPIHIHMQGKTILNKKQWYRICSRCNGIIFKGEGKIIGKCKSDSTKFWQHKKYGLCQKFKYGE